jgi:DNA-directed RNA polymerase subunit RPC12/RpoP
MLKSLVLVTEYLCPGCLDRVELLQSHGHVRTPRCARCKLLMLPLSVLARSRKKRPRRRR